MKYVILVFLCGITVSELLSDNNVCNLRDILLVERNKIKHFDETFELCLRPL